VADAMSDPVAGEAAYRPLGTATPEERDASGATSANTWRFAAADGARAEVAVLAADLVRVRLLPPGHEPAHSWLVDRADWPAVRVEADERGDGLTLATGALTVQVGTRPWRIAFAWPDGETFAADDPELGMGATGGAARCHKRLPAGAHVLGAGERTDPLDRRGRALTFWNLDPPFGHGEATRAMYLSVPFWLTLHAGRAHGILLDTATRAVLDAGAVHPGRLVFGADTPALTYYVFAGPTPAAVLARYADLTGHMPLPPRWALGYQQSRWSYYPDEYLRTVARELRAHRIPCDALYLDIDYMDGYRDFTWDARRFPDPAGLLRELGAAGFQVVTILNPGVKADPTDPTFADGLRRDAFCRRPDGSLFTGVVWPGECALPDFSRAEVRAWWGERHRELVEAGVAGIWDDMNEPSLTSIFSGGEPTFHGSTIAPDVMHRAGGADGPPLPHAAFHNAYGAQMARATHEALARLRPERRPFVLSRSGTAGVQRHAAIWTGDNHSRWSHLRLGLRMCLGLGLSGVPFVGVDVGGFWGDCTGELLVRFIQLGSLLPFFRDHSARHTHPQEPWAFGQPYEAFCRQAIERRYRLLPYLYTVFAEASASGWPILRPLAFAFPGDEAAAALDDQFLLGDALLAAPVLDEDAPERSIYFPEGTWVDLASGRRHAGPVRASVAAPLDALPLYARQGAILPLGPVMQHTGERPTDPITLACYLDERDGRAEGALYQDDGATVAYRAGAARRTRFAAARRGGRIELRAHEAEGAYDPGAHAWVAELHLPRAPLAEPPRPDAVRLEGRELREGDAPAPGAEAEPDEPPGWSVQARRYESVLRVALGRVAAPFTLEVELAG
jgi:alpha-glucosidase